MKLKLIALLAAVMALLFGRMCIAAENGKTLVIFFSHSGNTRFLAEMIHQQVGGDLVELKTVHPYPEAYDLVVDQAKREQQDNTRPQLATKVQNMESYSTLFIGYPNWWGTMPMALFTFFEEYNLSGKTIIPFCTHEGSNLGRSVSDMKKLAPRATILDGLAIRGRSVKNQSARTELADWLAHLHISNEKKDK
jgi:flavodoxin